MGEDHAGVTFSRAQFKWVSPEGKACLRLKCPCGELIEREISLRERTIISCPKCGEPIFMGEPENEDTWNSS